MISAIVLLLALPTLGQGCPHEGADHRLLGHIGCRIQRKMTIEHGRAPRTIWSFRVLRVSVKIDPKHPHLLMEWPARSQRLWRFRMGFRWDANAKAYIFPALAFKKVNGPMPEYQKDVRSRIAGKPTGHDENGEGPEDKSVSGLIATPAAGKEHAPEKVYLFH